MTLTLLLLSLLVGGCATLPIPRKTVPCPLTATGQCPESCSVMVDERMQLRCERILP